MGLGGQGVVEGLGGGFRLWGWGGQAEAGGVWLWLGWGVRLGGRLGPQAWGQAGTGGGSDWKGRLEL